MSPLSLETDLTIILVSTADTSQWNPEDLKKQVSKLHSKIPLRRTEMAQLLSYFWHPSNRQNRSQSLPTRSRRTGKAISTRSSAFFFFFNSSESVALNLLHLLQPAKGKMPSAAPFSRDWRKRISTCKTPFQESQKEALNRWVVRRCFRCRHL